MSERCIRKFSMDVVHAYRGSVGDTTDKAQDGIHNVLESSCDVGGCGFNCRLSIKIEEGTLTEVDNDSRGQCEEEKGHGSQSWDDQ